MASGGGDSTLATQYVEFIATGLDEVQQAMQGLLQGLIQVGQTSAQTFEYMEQVGRRAARAVQDIAGQAARTEGELRGLQAALGSPTYQGFVENLTSIQSKLDFARSVHSTTEALAALKGQLDPAVWTQLNSRLEEFRQNLDSGLHTEPLSDLRKELELLGQEQSARLNLAQMLHLLEDPTWTRASDNLRQLKIGEGLAEEAARVGAALRGMADQLEISRYLDLDSALKGVYEQLKRSDFGGAVDGLKRLGNALDGARQPAEEMTVVLNPLQKGLLKTQQAFESFVDQASSGEYQRVSEQLAGLKISENAVRSYYDATAALKALNEAMAEPAFAQFQADTAAIKNTLDWQTTLAATTASLGALNKAIASGEYVEQTSKLRQLREELASLQAGGDKQAQQNVGLPSLPQNMKITAPDFSEQGAEIGSSVLQGLQEAWSDLGALTKAAVGMVHQGIIGPIKEALVISSPSQVMVQFGKWIAEGLRLGILSGGPMLAHLQAELAVQLAQMEKQIKDYQLALNSGTYTEAAQKMAPLQREMEKLKKAMHWEDLKAQHGTLGAWMVYLKEQSAGVGQAAQQGFFRAALAANLFSAAITGTVGGLRGWIQSGMQGTTVGAAFALNMQLISREIVGVFLPVLNAMVRGLTAITQWLRNLSAAQQDNLLHWTAAAAAFAVTAAIFPRIATAIAGVLIPAFTLLKTLWVQGSIEMGTALSFATGGLSTLISLAVSLGAAMAIGTEGGRGALRGLLDSVAPLWEGLKEIGASIYNELAAPLEEAGKVGAAMLGALGKGLYQIAEALAPLIVNWAKLFMEAMPTMLSFLSQVIIPTIVILTKVLAGLFNLLATGLRIMFQSLGMMARQTEQQRAMQLGAAGRGTPEGGPGTGHRAAALTGGQFEQAGDIWKRLQSEAFKTIGATETPELRVMTQIHALLREWRGETNRETGAAARPALHSRRDSPMLPGQHLNAWDRFIASMMGYNDLAMVRD